MGFYLACFLIGFPGIILGIAVYLELKFREKYHVL